MKKQLLRKIYVSCKQSFKHLRVRGKIKESSFMHPRTLMKENSCRTNYSKHRKLANITVKRANAN